jgi:hypothetical protein
LVVPWVLLQDWSETDHFDLFFLSFSSTASPSHRRNKRS